MESCTSKDNEGNEAANGKMSSGSNDNNPTHNQKKTESEIEKSLPLRLMIIEHLITFDINISLLIDVIES
jgi:hypothetical protein